MTDNGSHSCQMIDRLRLNRNFTRFPSFLERRQKSQDYCCCCCFLQKHGSIFDIKSGWVEVGAAENGKKSWVKGTCSYWLFCFFSFFLFLNAILPAFNQWFQSMVLSPSIFYFFLSVCFSFFSHSVFWCGKWRKKTAF